MSEKQKRKVFPRAFLIGCDKEGEWMVDWWMRNYIRHNNKTPIIFADFGCSKRIVDTMNASTAVCAVMKINRNPNTPNAKTWFVKPETMWFAPAKECVWIDIDCEIKENIDGIFDHLVRGKLNMIEDKPWTKRRGEIWYNSGVVGFIDKPKILRDWAQMCTNPTKEVGDQEVLHSMLNPITQVGFINPLPNEYNVLRLQVEHDNYEGPAKIVHWTGAKGKERIRSMM